MNNMAEKHLVILQPSGRRGYVEDGITLRAAARELGVEIESICAEKSTCGKCKVLVEEGDFERYGIHSRRSHLSPMQSDEASYFAKRSKYLEIRGWTPGQVRLSCQARVHGDVLVQVPEESQGNKQIVRKAATERSFQIVPAVRKYYVELQPPTLAQPYGDWERLAEALAEAMRRVRGEEAGLPRAEDFQIDYTVLRELAAVLRQGEWRVTASVWMDHKVIRVQPGFHETSYGAAVDIGSTTLALYLCDLDSGAIVAAEAEMNPQIVYGEDILSRIQYTIGEPGGLETLHKAVIGALNQLLRRATRQAKIQMEDVLEMVLVGNTTMHHLVLNLPPRELGHSPYVPTLQRALDIPARELGLAIAPGANVHLLPIEASFVGADNVGVLIAEEPYNQDENWLIIDIGTNAELVLGNRERLICTSTPTGPALEGAHIEYGMRAAPGAIERVEIDAATLEPRYQVIGVEGWHPTESPTGVVKGICGSAIIDVVAEMFRVGIVDERGRFAKGLSSPRLRQGEHGWEYVLAWEPETSIGRDIPISISDVRAIQLAKGALYVAARALLREAGVAQPDKILLAGGFGSYVDKTKAMLIGMIPDCPLENVFSVGNSAGDGARIALLNVDKRREAQQIARQVRRFELPTDPDFQNQFMLALNFPHMIDSFPHVAHLIPNHTPDPMARRILGK